MSTASCNALSGSVCFSCARRSSARLICQIRLGNLEIQHRLAFGIVFGFDDLPGIVGIGGAETGASAGLGVNAVIGSATDSPADETVTCFHSYHATARINEAE